MYLCSASHWTPPTSSQQKWALTQSALLQMCAVEFQLPLSPSYTSLAIWNTDTYHLFPLSEDISSDHYQDPYHQPRQTWKAGDSYHFYCRVMIEAQLPAGIHKHPKGEGRRGVTNSHTFYHFILSCRCWMGVDTQLPTGPVDAKYGGKQYASYPSLIPFPSNLSMLTLVSSPLYCTVTILAMKIEHCLLPPCGDRRSALCSASLSLSKWKDWNATTCSWWARNRRSYLCLVLLTSLGWGIVALLLFSAGGSGIG